ncbi:MAG: lipid A biosynthesis acyltransferase [Gammaproteobacteria bacterium]|nr:MAG: lipid A biosynthesis acyltransferase [Gammaproteobacteria bacterium]
MTQTPASAQEHALLRLFRWIGGRSLTSLRRFGRFMGNVLYLSGRGPARVTRINIGLCFPELTDAQQRALTRASLQETAITGLEVAWAWTQPVETVLGQIREVDGDVTPDENGLIVLAPHLGNWEVLGLWLGQTQAQMASLYAPPNQPWLEPFMRQARERSGATLHPTDRRGVLQLSRCLKAGGTVGILPDQEPDFGSGEFAPFFGIPANTMTLAVKLAQKTGARVLAVAALRCPGDDGFRIIARSVDESIYAPDLSQALRAMNRAVEALVREAPAQYQWEYKRFKRRPDNRLPHVYDNRRRPHG